MKLDKQRLIIEKLVAVDTKGQLSIVDYQKEIDGILKDLSADVRTNIGNNISDLKERSQDSKYAGIYYYFNPAGAC